MNSGFIVAYKFSMNVMSEINLKDNDKKIGITDTEILKFVIGNLFVY